MGDLEEGELYEDEEIKAIVPCAFDQDGRPVHFYIVTSFRVFVLKDEECTQIPWRAHRAVATIQ